MIRIGTKKDALALASISKDSLHPAWKEADFLAAMENTQARVFVFGDEPQGYGVFYFAADEGEIPSIAVRKEFRKQGAGKELLEAMVSFSKEAGVKRIFLEVRVSNETAISFYKGNGFSEVGKRPKFYDNPTEDGLILEKTF